jgi:hypothetical protein
MDAYIAAAKSTALPDAEQLARYAYNKRMYGATYPPAIEANILEATRILSATSITD